MKEYLRCNRCKREIKGLVVMMPSMEKIERIQCTDCAREIWTNKSKCPITDKEGYVKIEDCHCFCCGNHKGIQK